MRKAISKGAITFVAVFILLFLATGFALQEGEKALSLFAGAALSSRSAKDAPGVAATDLAVILKERPDELIAGGARFLRSYGYLPDNSYINRHRLTCMNLALAFAAGFMASFQSIREEKSSKRVARPLRLS